MADGPPAPPDDRNWPKLLSHAAHELRSPLTTVAGYINLVLKGLAGPVAEQQRRLLEEAEKSCGRLSAIIAEMSELSQLEAGTVRFNRKSLDLASVLSDAIAALPDLPDRSISIDLTVDETTPVEGDAVRLKAAFSAILRALRRELVTSERLMVRIGSLPDHGTRVAIGEPDRIEPLMRLGDAGLGQFDEWRGGNGLSLTNARYVIEAHGGRLCCPAGQGKATAIIMFGSERRLGE
jgi:signal transduction histidine kinase